MGGIGGRRQAGKQACCLLDTATGSRSGVGSRQPVPRKKRMQSVTESGVCHTAIERDKQVLIRHHVEPLQA